MENLLNVANYIYERYKDEYNSQIDEMKFHKVMYFAQRESIIQTDELLFEGTFYGWKYGPVLKEIRSLYINDSFDELVGLTCKITEAFKNIMDYVFRNYVPKDSWTLSMLSHNEISWKNSRKGIQENENGDKKIKNKDIVLDAQRIKKIRTMIRNSKKA